MGHRTLVVLLLVLLAALTALFVRGSASEDPPEVVRAEGTRADEPPRLRGRGLAPAPASATRPASEAPTTPSRPAPHAPGGRVEGHVLGMHDGRPIEGAAVQATCAGAPALVLARAAGGPLAEALSDADGWFGLNGLPDGERCLLRVRAAGFAARSVYVRVPPVEAIEIRLDEGACVQGRVLDPDGAPVAGAHVLLDFDRERGATTDERGRYVIAGLGFGRRYCVEARAAGYAASASEQILTLDELRPTTERDLVLHRAATLLVHVLDEQGLPVATVQSADLVGLPVGARLGPRGPKLPGIARFEQVAPGRHRLRIMARGYVAWDGEVDVPAGESTELAVRLARGLALPGVVVDDRGEPVARAEVSATIRYQRVAEAETDGAGHFRLEGLRALEYRIGAEAVGHADAVLEKVEPTRTDLAIVLPRSAEVRFRLALPESVAPPADFDVLVVQGRRSSSSGRRWKEGTHSAYVPPAPSTFAIAVRGLAFWTTLLDLRPAEVLDLGTIQLEVGFALELLARDATGEPVGSATICVLRSDALWRQDQARVTDTQGRAILQNLTRGPHTLVIEAEGFFPRVVELEATAAQPPFELELARGGWIRGHVVDTAGAPLVEADVGIYPITSHGMSDSGLAASTDAGGRFESRVEPGTWRFRVWLPDGAEFLSEDLQVAEGGTYDVVLRVP